MVLVWPVLVRLSTFLSVAELWCYMSVMILRSKMREKRSWVIIKPRYGFNFFGNSSEVSRNYLVQIADMCDAPCVRLGKEIKNKKIFSSETYSRSRADATRNQRLNNHRRSLRHVTAVKRAACPRPAAHCHSSKISNNSLRSNFQLPSVTSKHWRLESK